MLALAATAYSTPSWAGDTGSIMPDLITSRFQAGGGNTPAPGHLNNFSPAAINYADCASQIDIQFTLDLPSIPPGDEIQIWAGAGSADCTEVSARTAGSSASPETFPGRCWPVSNPIVPSGSTATPRLHVLDLISNIGQDNPWATYAEVQSQVATDGVSLCQPVATIGAVELNIYFIFVPVGSGAGSIPAAIPDGVSGLYQTPAALVGPFAPTDVTIPTGSLTPTSLTVTWTPQAERSIQGFNVYLVDQGPDGGSAGARSVDAAPVSRPAQLYCRTRATCTAPTIDGGAGTKDTGTDTGAHDGGHDATLAETGTGADTGSPASGDGGVDATVKDAGKDTGVTQVDAAVMCDAGLTDALGPVDAAAYADVSEASLPDLGCIIKYGTNGQNTGEGGVPQCYSALLQNVFTVDGGLGTVATSTDDAALATTIATTTDDADVDAGDFEDAGTASDASMAIGSTSITASTPEIAGISNITLTPSYVPGATTSSYTYTGLTTGSQYAVAVAAVDSYGNVGPIGAAPSQSGGATGLAACSTPTLVDDFFTAYLGDGGQGSGYCAVGFVGAPAQGAAGIAGAGLLAAAIARSRRRRRERNA